MLFPVCVSIPYYVARHRAMCKHYFRASLFIGQNACRFQFIF